MLFCDLPCDLMLYTKLIANNALKITLEKQNGN